MGKQSVDWHEYQTKEYARPVVKIKFRNQDCLNCPSRNQCVRSKKAGRSMQIPGREMYEALGADQEKTASDAGRNEYKKRAGIEGTISQGVRRGSMRRSRYIGLEKTHLQEVATGAAINIVRAVNFLNGETSKNKGFPVCKVSKLNRTTVSDRFCTLQILLRMNI
jgi:transposase